MLLLASHLVSVCVFSTSASFCSALQTHLQPHRAITSIAPPRHFPLPPLMPHIPRGFACSHTRSTPPLYITYSARGTPKQPAATPCEQPRLTVTVLADDISTPAYTECARDVRFAAATPRNTLANPVCFPPCSRLAYELPPGARVAPPHFLTMQKPANCPACRLPPRNLSLISTRTASTRLMCSPPRNKIFSYTTPPTRTSPQTRAFATASFSSPHTCPRISHPPLLCAQG